MKPTDNKKDEYYFGTIEVIPFENQNIPQFELSVFASADINGGFCDGGFGDNRSCSPIT